MNKRSMAALAKQDPKFAKVIKRFGLLELNKKRSKNPYEALVEAVVYQQLTGKAAATIFGRLRAIYSGRKFPTPQQLLDTPIQKFREAGLSQSKALSVHDIAAKTLDGTVPTMRKIEKMSETEIVETLTRIRGVGQWTVEMFLIFRLGRTDVLPVTDYGIQKGFMKAFNKRKLPTPKELDRYGQKWQPHRTTAALYLWHVVNTQTPSSKSR